MGLLTGGGRQQLFMGPLTGTIIWLLLRSIFKLSGIDIFLSNLKAFYIQDQDATEGQQKSDMTTRKGRKQAAKQQLLLKGLVVPNAFIVPVGSDVVRRTVTFAKDFDDLVLASVLVACNTAVAILGAWLLGSSGNLSMSFIAVAVLGFGVLLALKVDFASDTSGNMWEKLHLLILAAAGAAASAYLLSPWSPTHLLVDDFGYKAAEGAISQSANSILEQMKARLGPAAADIKPRQHGPVLLLGLCLFAGLMAASLFGPATRFAKCLYAMSQVPGWGAQYLTPTKAELWKARAGVIAPLLVVALQIQPLVDLWGIPTAWHQQLLSGALLLTALLHASTVSATCQAWLNTGLTTWFANRHSGLEHPRKAELMRIRLTYTRALLCRSAVQVFALATITACAAVLLALHTKGGLLHSLCQPGARAGPIAAWEALERQQWAAPLLNTLSKAASALNPSTSSASTSTSQDPAAAAAADGGLEGLDDPSTPPTPSTPAGPGVGLDLAPLFVFLGQYYGWWACLVWSVVACATLAVQRLGLNG